MDSGFIATPGGRVGTHQPIKVQRPLVSSKRGLTRVCCGRCLPPDTVFRFPAVAADLVRSRNRNRWAVDETSLPASRTREVNAVSSGWVARVLEGRSCNSIAGTRWLGTRSNPRKRSAVQTSREAGARHAGGEAERRACTRYAEQRPQAGGTEVTKRYLIVMESTSTGLSACSPDLPGCVATGASEAEVEARMRDAIQLHLAGLRNAGEPVPEPHALSSWVEVPA
jgi:predicted RNase H-like HicB family nuclease